MKITLVIASTIMLYMSALTSAHATNVPYKHPADTSKTKTNYRIKDKRYDKTPEIKVYLTPFKPLFGRPPLTANSNTTSKATSVTGEKAPERLISNVKVYPNPVSDVLNLSYHIGRDANVMIKVTDLLGNDVTTLANERTQAGEQVKTFSVASKLGSGLYFVRIIAGNETVIRRISVL